jgi:DNA-binding response OmpR family regulator
MVPRISEKPVRILVVDDAGMLGPLLGVLTEGGVEADMLLEPTGLLAKVTAFKPHLIIASRLLRHESGLELAERMRASSELKDVPLALIWSEPTPMDLLRATWAGVDLLVPGHVATAVNRLNAYLPTALTSIEVPPGPDAQRVQRLLRLAQFESWTGTLRLNPSTPFEGRAQFAQGKLTSAELGPFGGFDAVEQMLWFEDGVWRFERPTVVFTPPPPPPPRSTQDPLPPSAFEVLFVDDDPDLRLFYESRLRAAGCVARTASDGEQAIAESRRRPPDLILADIDMPQLDGWGMLRRLKSDHHTREIPVLFLSGQTDSRETLRAARAGAHDYLSKGLPADQVIRQVLVCLGPRMAAQQELRAGVSAEHELSLIGTQWLLRLMASLRLTGVLEAEDEWGKYVLRMSEGEPVDARSFIPARPAEGLGAVAALLMAKGARAVFRPEAIASPRRLAPSVGVLLERACDALNKLDQDAVRRRLGAGERLEVDAELYALFQRLGKPQDVQVARAICEQRLPPEALPEALSISPERVEHGLRELLRRRVIHFAR